MDARLERELKVRGYEVNAAGRVSPATLLRYLEGVRWEAVHTLPPIALLFSNGRTTLVRVQRLAVERELTVGDLLTISLWPGKLGRSSVELRHEVQLANSGELVARAAMVGVHVEASGRPCPLPEELYSLNADQSDWLPIQALADEQRPGPDSFVETVSVRPSHLDSFRHVNHAQYVDWINDTRQLGATARAYGEASPLAAGRLREICIDYRREAVLGDELTLTSWLLPRGGVGAEVRRGSEVEPLCRARLEIEAV